MDQLNDCDGQNSGELCLEPSHVVARRIQSCGTKYAVRCHLWEPRLTLVSMATKALVVGVVKLTPDVSCQFRKSKPNLEKFSYVFLTFLHQESRVLLVSMKCQGK